MSKLRSAFGIDDILCQSAVSSAASQSPSHMISEPTSDYTPSAASPLDDGAPMRMMSPDVYASAVNQPRKPYPLFPSAMDFTKSSYYMPGFPPAFSPTAYLEQYANALKGE